MSAGPTQLAGVGDRGSSSHHPPPPPPPKILLAKPPLPPPSSSSGADDDGGARARQGPQPGSLSLVSDAWEVHTDKILPYLTENNDFMVIGVIGPPGVGKSAIMNELYGYDANSPGLAIVIMGVSGCGKSTVAALLAEALGCSFIEADDYHSEANKAKMSKGIPLTDTDHIPWLESLRDAIRERLDRGEDVAVSCSALQLIYREILREGDRRYKAGSYGSCRVKFVCLEASAEVIGERIRRRSMEGEHFMPASLLQSQLDLLQIDDAEGVTKVDATVCPEAIVHGTIAQFREELASTVLQTSEISKLQHYPFHLKSNIHGDETRHCPCHRCSVQVDLLKHNIPDPSLLTSSSSPDKENKNDYQSGSEEYMADLCFVHAGLREQDFSPSKLMLLRKILEKHFESSSFSIGSSGATPQVSDSSVSSSLKVEDLNSSRQDVFLLPRAPDNSTKFEYGTYSSMLSVLRDQILSRPPRSFSKNLSERDWLRSTAKIWDMVKKSPVITECCKALQSSGLFRK